MKNIVFLLIFSFMALVTQTSEAKLFGDGKDKKSVAVAPAVVKTTTDDLKKILISVQSLSKRQKAELVEAKKENDAVNKELTSALFNSDTLQKKVDEVTESRNAEAAAKDAALDIVDKLKLEINKLTKEVHKLKAIICGQAALVALLICLWLGLPRWSFPWGLVATVAAPGLVFGVVWFWL